MKNKNGEFPNYKLFNSISHTNVPTFNKIIMIIFFIYMLLTFSDEGLINALSEQIISDYNISPEKYSLIRISSCLGQILCSFVLLKIVKKIIQLYKFVNIFFLIIKSLILISYYYHYSFSIFLLTRFISNFIRIYEFFFFMTWFAQQLKRPIFGIFGFLLTLLCIQLGNALGFFFNYINIEKVKSEKWRNNFLILGIIHLVFSFLLMLINSSDFKLKKNIYYPSSRLGNKSIENNNNRNSYDTNSPESSEGSNSHSIINLDTLNQIKNKIEKMENKYNLYDLSLEEKLKQISVSEFNYYSELKSMIFNKLYIFTLISLSILFLIYYTILFWSNNFIINYLKIYEPNKIFHNYLSICFFGPSLGISVNRAVNFTLTNYKREYNLLTMLICAFALCIFSILIQTKILLEFIIIFFIVFTCYIFNLIPSVLVIHLKHTEFTFKKEDFVMLIIAKNLFGEIIGNLIYIYLIKNNNIMNGIGMILNFSWVLFGVLGFTLLFEFNTADKKVKKKKINEDKKIKNYRTTITSDIQGEELKDIDKRESIISVDDNDDDNINDKNKENEYSLDDYFKK